MENLAAEILGGMAFDAGRIALIVYIVLAVVLAIGAWSALR